jgi:hypothetical protein
VAMELRALALQEQARRIQLGEIVCVANHDVETYSSSVCLHSVLCTCLCQRTGSGSGGDQHASFFLRNSWGQ